MSASHSLLKSESEIENLLTGFTGPPSLNYSLYDRKKSIAITWTVISFDSCILPITLYYVLWFGTTLSHNMGGTRLIFCTIHTKSHFKSVFTIMTAVFGVPTVVNFSKRMYNLLKKDPVCRPIGSKRGWVSHLFQGPAILPAPILIHLPPA